MKTALANIPQLIARNPDRKLRGLQLFGVLEERVMTPWFLRDKPLPAGTSYALVRVFAVRPLQDCNVVFDEQADLYYAKGRVLILLPDSTLSSLLNMWVTVGGSRPFSGLTLTHGVMNDTNSPYNIIGVPFSRKNPGSPWSVVPNSITDVLYIPNDPANPSAPHPSIHVGFDFPGHETLMPFDGLDVQPYDRVVPPTLRPLTNVNRPFFPSPENLRKLYDPEASSTPSAASPSPSPSAPASSSGYDFMGYSHKSSATRLVYTDDIIPPSDTLPHLTVIREESDLSPDHPGYSTLLGSLKESLAELTADFHEQIPFPTVESSEVDAFCEGFLKLLPSVPLPPDFQDGFERYLRKSARIDDGDLYEVVQSAAWGTHYVVALAQTLGNQDAVRHFISWLCESDSPMISSDFRGSLRDPWSVQCLSSSSSYRLAFRLDALLRSPTLQGISLRDVNPMAVSALAHWAGYYSSSGDDSSTLLPYSHFSFPNHPDINQYLLAFKASKTLPQFIPDLGNTPGIVSLDPTTQEFLPILNLSREVKMLENIVEASCSPTRVTDQLIDKTLESFQESRGFELSEDQIKGVRLTKHRAGVLSGCAGSGKTTTSDCITEVLEAAGYEVLFVAPTGKAAKRLAEVVGRPVRTIHSLFRIPVGSLPPFDPSLADTYPYVNLPKDVALIIDESAMGDTSTFTHMVNSAFKSNPDILIYFLGDIKQLPPIGRGMPFRDIMAFAPTVELGVSRRAAAGSLINYNCNVLNQGSPLVIPPSTLGTVYGFKSDNNFHLFECMDNQISPVIVGYCRQLVEGGTAPEDIQVISPYVNPKPNRDWDSTTLNKHLQGVLNPSGELIFSHSSTYFKYGDRVIHTRNDRERPRLGYNPDTKSYFQPVDPESKLPITGVVNGEVGTIHAFLPVDDPSLTSLSLDTRGMVALVKVEDPEMLGGYSYIPYMGSEGAPSDPSIPIPSFRSKDMWDLKLAYAITVHKSQGSQYPVVVFPIGSHDHESFVNRNMIYTAISRAQKTVAMVGSLKDSLNRLRLSHIDGANCRTAARLIIEEVMSEGS